MVIAFLLAQLVLPGPPSSPIQPPGMICASGSCERGPMVYRTSASRSRLVVACDMRSDTCSDGRKITTQRATPVPCETSPGVWEMVPADTGCYGVRGLESWRENTSYVAYGAELDRSPWVVMTGSAITRLQDGGYRLCHISETAHNSGINQPYSAGLQDGELVTLAVIARPNTASAIHLAPTGSKFGVLQMPSEWWGRYFHAAVYNDGALERVYIYPRPGGQQLCIDLLAAWLTKSDTPGRACWGGEAPVTCAADRHTISTEGWPTEAGEICLTYEDSGEVSTRVLIEGRPNSGSGAGTFLWITGGSYELDIAGTKIRSNSGTVINGQPVRVCLGRKDGNGYISVNGVRYNGGPIPPFEWEPVASIGRGRVSIYQGISGSIRSLIVRSYEEVSP